ncbi:MAG: segregation/condensation protein A [bacterium]|nr:segregation/condensation protein A [bacterium]
MFSESIEIHLQEFEGPIDLLLYLIRKNEIDIYDIPITKITEEYLEIIDKMKDLKIDIASDYIVMAATLVKIKSDMMLPQQTDGEEVDDPRRPLVDKLLEYQRFKKASELFRSIEYEAGKLYSRNITFVSTEAAETEENLSLSDLMGAFMPLLKRGLSLTSYRMPKVRKTITEKVREILDYLENKEKISFLEYILSQETMFEVILSFVAILDMAQKDIVKVRQENQFEDIWITLC